MSLDDLFDGMEKLSVDDRADFFKEGIYAVDTKSFEYRDGYKGKSFIAKFTVRESTNPEIPPGSTRSWILKLDGAKDKRDRALGDIKGLFFALSGTTAKEVGTPEKNPKVHEQAVKMFKCSIDEAYAKANGVDSKLLLGRPVKLECTSVKSEKEGKTSEFTRHAWSPAT